LGVVSLNWGRRIAIVVERRCGAAAQIVAARSSTSAFSDSAGVFWAATSVDVRSPLLSAELLAAVWTWMIFMQWS
jgi:hypothetical protein